MSLLRFLIIVVGVDAVADAVVIVVIVAVAVAVAVIVVAVIVVVLFLSMLIFPDFSSPEKKNCSEIKVEKKNFGRTKKFWQHVKPRLLCLLAREGERVIGEGER